MRSTLRFGNHGTRTVVHPVIEKRWNIPFENPRAPALAENPAGHPAPESPEAGMREPYSRPFRNRLENPGHSRIHFSAAPRVSKPSRRVEFQQLAIHYAVPTRLRLRAELETVS